MTSSERERALRTVALVKQVPTRDHSGALDGAGRLTREGHDAEMNPWCRRAVTHAVRLARDTGGNCTVITMGPPQAADVLREAVACGADEGVHICDPALAGADCLVTARTLAAAIRALRPVDVIVAGRSSVDGSTGAIGVMVAALLDLPFAGPARSLDLDGTATHLRMDLEADFVTQTVDVTLPAVVAVAERSARAARAARNTWPAAPPIRRLPAAGMDRFGEGGLASPTRVLAVRDATRTRRPVMLSGTPAQQVARALDLIRRADAPSPVPAPRLPVRPPGWTPRGPAVLALLDRSGDEGRRALLGQAATLAERIGGHMVAVRSRSATGDPAAWGADAALDLTGDAPRPAATALAAHIRGGPPPWAVLGGPGAWDREVLGRLAADLGTGLISDLTGIEVREDEPAWLIGVKPSGRGTLAEIVTRGRPRLATLRTGCLPIPAPRASTGPIPVTIIETGRDDSVRHLRSVTTGDYDALERAEVVIGVGAGVDPTHYGELEPLRILLDAPLAATRKVTDAGSLPHSSQVGVTGRSIAPRLYLAFGISGSDHHTVGLDRAGTIVAVNDDPQAPIFAQCDIGIVADWQRVVPLLVAGFGLATATAAIGTAGGSSH
jgi:electron transfer flavoprotein alpha subunit